MSPRRSAAPTVIGWREWVALPGLGVPAIKVKVDTGATTSSLHAFGLESFERDGTPWVRFGIHPAQRSSAGERIVEAPVQEWRKVRPSTGAAQSRPVIVTQLDIAPPGGPTGAEHISYPIELTLTRRDMMGFRMLLGRQALRKRFLVDPGRSYLAGTPSD